MVLPTRSAGVRTLREDDHNGIEYGLLQAYARLRDPARIETSAGPASDLLGLEPGSVGGPGSMLAERAFAKDTELAALRGYVEDSVRAAGRCRRRSDLDVPAPVITLSLLAVPVAPSDSFVPSHRGAAQRVRRTRGQESMTTRASTSVAVPQEFAKARVLRRAEPCSLVIFGPAICCIAS